MNSRTELHIDCVEANGIDKTKLCEDQLRVSIPTTRPSTFRGRHPGMGTEVQQ